MRLRLPGGRLPAATLRAIADLARRHADGGLDLTARANIQLRGIRPDGLGPLAEGLAAAGLLPSPAHDRIRNILVSPFAGADPAERIDLTPLAAELDQALLADATLAHLPAKFAFTLDGGGRGFDPGGADLTLAAAGARLHLSLAGRATGLGTTSDGAVTLLIRACHALSTVAAAHGIPARARAIVKRPAAYADFIGRLDAEPCAAPPPRPIVPGFGLFDEPDPDRATLLPILPFGRLDADTALKLSDQANRFGLDMRLTPWRTLALRHIRRGDIADLGLALDGADGFAGLAACAGSEGCAQSLADVRGDARRFAASIAGPAADAGWAIHFAGCAKRCALKGPATVDLIATENGYDVLFDGNLAHSGLNPAEALAAARTAYPRKAPQVP